MNCIKKLLMICLAVVFALTIRISFADAALYDATISGLNGTIQVENFTIWFKIGDTFSISNFTIGDAIPTTGTLGWEFNVPGTIADDATRGHIVKFAAFDQDGLFLSAPVYLMNGTLFSFEYTGDLLGFTDIVQFDPGDGSNLYPTKIRLQASDSTGAHFSAVPIPATALLFLSGIFGLVGLKRFGFKK